MIIMGIDPGIGITGYSFIDYQTTSKGEYFNLITSGSIHRVPSCSRWHNTENSPPSNSTN